MKIGDGYDVAMRVCDELNLNVSRMLNVLFDQQTVIGKARPCLCSGKPKVFLHILLAPTEMPLPRSLYHAMRMPLPPPPAEALIITG